jgi:hypothetical protein
VSYTIGLCPAAIRAVWRKINLYYDVLLLTCVNAIHTSYCVSKHLVRTAYSPDCLLKSSFTFEAQRSSYVTTRSYFTENTACLHYKDRRVCAACCHNRTKQDKHKVTMRRVRVTFFCPGKVISTTHSECVCVCVCVCVCSLIYQTCTAHARYYSVISGLSDCTTFSPIISQTARFSEEKK